MSSPEHDDTKEEEKESSSIVKTLQALDDIIGEYYKKMGEKNYYENSKTEGKFKLFVDENGFEDDSLMDEFDDDMGPSDCSYLGFDEDATFPFDEALKYKPNDKNYQSERDQKLFEFLKYCYMNGQHPEILSDPNKINFDILDSSNDDKKIELIREKYMEQTPTICQQIALNDDDNMMMGLTVGNENNIPFLQYLTDIYQRDRMQLLLQQQTNINIDINTWCDKNGFIQQIQERYQNSNKTITMIKHAIPSYIKRIQPQFIINPIGFSKIVDDISEIARYFQCASQFIQFMLRQKTDAATLPFQWDFAIAVKEAVSTGKPLEIPFDDDDDDEDDEDDPDDIEDDDKFYDVIGCIKEKLSKNKLIHGCDVIDRQEESKEEVRNVTRIFSETYNKFKKQMIEEFGKSFPRKKRFIALVDRRRYITSYSGNPPDIKLKYESKNDDSKDEIIFFTPPKNANDIPDHHVPEIYFNNLRQCLLPNFGYIDNKIDIINNNDKNLDKSDNYLLKTKVLSHITSHESCNGALLIFSFAVEQEDEIKCYLWWQGKCIRFLPGDIIDILPQIFDLNAYENKKFAQSRDAKQIVTGIHYKDKHFNNWFKKISILDDPKKNLEKYIIPKEKMNDEK